MRSSFRAFACRASVHRIRCSGALESRGRECQVGSSCGGRLSPSRHRTCFAPTDRSAPPERRPRLTREHKPDKDSRRRVPLRRPCSHWRAASASGARRPEAAASLRAPAADLVSRGGWWAERLARLGPPCEPDLHLSMHPAQASPGGLLATTPKCAVLLGRVVRGCTHLAPWPGV